MHDGELYVPYIGTISSLCIEFVPVLPLIVGMVASKRIFAPRKSTKPPPLKVFDHVCPNFSVMVFIFLSAAS